MHKGIAEEIRCLQQKSTEVDEEISTREPELQHFHGDRQAQWEVVHINSGLVPPELRNSVLLNTCMNLSVFPVIYTPFRRWQSIGFIFVADGNASALCVIQQEQSYEPTQRLR